MGFKGIVGHEDIIAHFKSSIETGNVAHAYIISGDAGSGKKALAYAFAETLECEAGGTEACGTCQSCLQVSTGNYPDIITVTHEKPNLISVDEVRDQLINTIDIKPYKGKYKIYIIPDAELLNVQAQNAMLKTIEEPPAYAVILLLTTNLDKLLETVKSRCLKLQTKPIRERDVLAYLTNVMGLTKEKAYFCLDFAQGNLGKAIINYADFEKRGFVVCGVFDSNPELEGQVIRDDISIMMMDKLEDFIKNNNIEIAALTIPKEAARKIGRRVADAGIKAIWNFAHTDLNLPDDVIVENVHLSESLMRLSYNIANKN